VRKALSIAESSVSREEILEAESDMEMWDMASASKERGVLRIHVGGRGLKLLLCLHLLHQEHRSDLYWPRGGRLKWNHHLGAWMA